MKCFITILLFLLPMVAHSESPTNYDYNDYTSNNFRPYPPRVAENWYQLKHGLYANKEIRDCTIKPLKDPKVISAVKAWSLKLDINSDHTCEIVVKDYENECGECYNILVYDGESYKIRITFLSEFYVYEKGDFSYQVNGVTRPPYHQQGFERKTFELDKQGRLYVKRTEEWCVDDLEVDFYLCYITFGLPSPSDYRAHGMPPGEAR